ncbi:hypothetical protein lerEdw1_010457 [Lerista edwardsae]|nr:hypothetical protein lerEdw1_010457 [Lerista edwardsae]
MPLDLTCGLHLLSAATSNLDLDAKKPTPPKLLWHQPVNIFLARPVGVEELHHEAELNLQSLLQADHEDFFHLTLHNWAVFFQRSTKSPTQMPGGATKPSATPTPSLWTGPSTAAPGPPPAKRLEFVFMPANQQVKESETTTLGVRAPESSLSLPTTPDKHTAWTRSGPLPSLEGKRLHQSCSTQANIVPINVTGQPFARHASARHSLFNTETAMNPKSLLRRRRTVIGFPHLALRDPGNSNGPILNPPATIAESVSCNFVPDAANGRSAAHQSRSPHPRPQLRKTFSDLGGALQGRCCQGPAGRAENPAGMQASLSCNGPTEDSAFSPAWSAASFGYVSPSASQSELAEEGAAHPYPCGPSGTPDRPPSFFIGKDHAVGNSGPGSFCGSPESPREAEGAPRCAARAAKSPAVPPSPGEEECPPLERERVACTFRERSLSVPTDTASLCSVDIGGSETCGLSYPSASSEGSTSTDNVSLAVEQDAHAQRRRQYVKSISLRKAKKKPCPPARSVSLIKDGHGAQAELGGKALPQDQRPKSLCLLPEAPVQGHAPADAGRELESGAYPPQWYLPEWGSGDPYCSLSGSSTATGATVIDLSKACGSSESLPSPSISRATTPSQASAEVSLKTSSPGRPAGVMSPSSGYSSQSETPTPTVPTSVVLGPPSGRARPLVPERKSSLPPVSPMERSPKSRLSFDLPFAPPTHLDLSGMKISLKGKAKISRHHSDCTFGTKLGPKLSPVQPVMPMVTQLDLRSVRLRSISRSETEDNLDSPEPLEEPGKKVRPPVAEKPPLSRRPPLLLHKTPPVQEESPDGSPTSPRTPQGLTPTENVYMVARRPEHRWDADAWSPVEPPSPRAVFPSQGAPGTFFSATRQLSEDSLEEDSQPKPRLPAERTPGGGEPQNQRGCFGDARLPASPIILLDEDSAYSELDLCKLPSPMASERHVSPTAAGRSLSLCLPTPHPFPGNSVDLRGDEKSFVSDKTAESITEEDDDVFVTSRTTEDLFTVIHRSKRKLLGWKEPTDAFGSRQNSQAPSKGSLGGDCPPTGHTRASSRNEDFKALLQKKGSKGVSGIRTSAAELLKSTNPLARRVMTEFAMDGTIQASKGQP